VEGASCGLASLAVLPALAAHPFTARVFRVTDGDPITVEAPGYIVRVRLFGIDCPARNQDGGPQATWFTRDAALDRTDQVTAMAAWSLASCDSMDAHRNKELVREGNTGGTRNSPL
jgi:endonuclease YncB( thermonuclease family)